jgi:hypothetical protein
MSENSVLQDISTHYDPEKHKDYLSYSGLYNDLAYILKIDAQNLFDRNDNSGIFNKLKSELHFDIKEYAKKSEEEKFNTLKLLYFMIIKSKDFKKYNKKEPLPQFFINLISNPSLDHTDMPNAEYKKPLKKIISELHTVVANADERDKIIDTIHQQWLDLFSIISDYAIRDWAFDGNVRLPLSDYCRRTLKNIESPDTQYNDVHYKLKSINSVLDSIINSLDIQKICKLNRTNETVIDTFYNIIRSHFKIADIKSRHQTCSKYDDINTRHTTVPPMFKLLDKKVEWDYLYSILTQKAPDLDNKEIYAIWNLILDPEEKTICAADVIKFREHNPAYNFAIKHTQRVAESWIKEHLKIKYITIFQWLSVFIELMYIHKTKPECEVTSRQHNHSTKTLTSFIKKMEVIPPDPLNDLIKRLDERCHTFIDTQETLPIQREVYSKLLTLEEIVFSYHNIEDIITAHNFLYIQVFPYFTALSPDAADTINNAINYVIANQGYNYSINIIKDSRNNYLSLLRLLEACADSYFDDNITIPKEKLKENAEDFITKAYNIFTSNGPQEICLNIEKAFADNEELIDAYVSLNSLNSSKEQFITKTADEIIKAYSGNGIRTVTDLLYSISISIKKTVNFSLAIKLAIDKEDGSCMIKALDIMDQRFDDPSQYKKLLSDLLLVPYNL